MIKVSIAIPVYNVSKYVEKSLRSALNQDFQEDYEVLVIDDCGTDNSMEIVRNVVANHVRGNIVRIIQHEKNMGLGPARNTSIENAQGKYLFFLDSDDWISTDCLSVLYKEAEAENADAVVGSLYRVEEKSERILERNIYPYTIVDKVAAGVYMLNHAPDMHVEVWNKLFRLDYLKVNKIGCVHRIFEDYNFDFKFRATVSKIILIPKVTLFYNIRENSILRQLKAKNGSEESMVILCDIVNVLQRLTSFYKDVAGIYDLYFQRLIWVFENFKRYSYSPEQWIYIKEHLEGSQDYVPCIDCLSNSKHRFIYKKSHGKRGVDAFYKANKIINSRLWRKFHLMKLKIRGFFA